MSDAPPPPPPPPSPSEPDNPYSAPQAAPEAAGRSDLEQSVYGSRGKRLLARFLDSLIVGIPVALVMAALMAVSPLFFGVQEGEGYLGTMQALANGGFIVQFRMNLLSVVFTLLIWWVINFAFLTEGQTLGKKICKLRMVDASSQQVPAMNRLVWAREAFYVAIPLLPFVGGLISLVGVLLIFRENRQCLHDMVARTYVVEA